MLSAPSGWVKATEGQYGVVNYPTLALFYKVASSEGTTFQFDNNAATDMGAIVVEFSGLTATPLDNTDFLAPSWQANTAAAGIIDTTTADSLVVMGAAIGNNLYGETFSWTDADWSLDYVGTSTIVRDMSIAYKIHSTTQTDYEDAATWTSTSRLATVIAGFKGESAGSSLTLTPNGDGTNTQRSRRERRHYHYLCFR